MFRYDLVTARIGIFLAMFMYATFAVLDLWIVPDYVAEIWWIRSAVIVVFSVLFVFTFSSPFRKHYQISQCIVALAGGFGVISIIYLMPVPEGYLYYPALIFTFIFFYTMLGLRFINALMANIAILLGYNLVIVGFKEIPVYMILNNNYFLAGGTIVIALAGYVIEQQRRLGFLKSLCLEELRKKADDANAAKSRFFAGMSHELRTPLNAIIGYSEILLEDEKKSGDSEKIKDLVSIETAGRHLLRLINNVLDLAKIEAGKTELMEEDVSIRELVSHIKASIVPLAGKNHNQLLINSRTAPAVMRTDSMRLEQVLVNLLSNACKFTENGRISLDITGGQDSIEFRISDTGIGMTRQQIEGLYNEYSQADAGISREYGGTGLGLAISKQLVELMHGSITVESEAGKGTTFLVKFPLT